jgi:hypothetical protein
LQSLTSLPDGRLFLTFSANGGRSYITNHG